MNQSQRQSSLNFKAKSNQTLTYASQNTLKNKSTKHILEEDGLMDCTIWKKRSNKGSQDQQYIYQLKLKLFNTYRLVSQTNFTELQKYSIEDLLSKLHKCLKQKINDFQKHNREYEKQIKLLEIDKINLQTEIQANSVDCMKITSQNSKNLRIIASDRDRYTRKIQQKDRQIQENDRKIVRMQMLLKQQERAFKQTNLLMKNQKNELQTLKKQAFEKQKANIQYISQAKIKINSLTIQNQGLKESLLRNCQQKNTIVDNNTKLSQNLQKQKQKLERSKKQIKRLESENQQLLNRIQKISAQNTYLGQQINHERWITRQLQAKLQKSLTQLDRIKNIQQRMKNKLEQLAKYKQKIANTIKQITIKQQKWVQITKKYDGMVSQLQNKFINIDNLYQRQFEINIEVNNLCNRKTPYNTYDHQLQIQNYKNKQQN